MSTADDTRARRSRTKTLPFGDFSDVNEAHHRGDPTEPGATPIQPSPPPPRDLSEALAPRSVNMATPPPQRPDAQEGRLPSPERVSVLLAALGTSPNRPLSARYRDAVRKTPPPPVPARGIADVETVVEAEELGKDDLEEVVTQPPITTRAETMPMVSVPPIPPTLVTRKKQWFDWVFDEDYAALTPYITPQRTQADVTMIEEWLELMEPRDILDLGCGSGRHAIELAAHAHRVTGYDLSPPMLDLARDHAKNRGVDIRFVCGDFRDLSWDQAFDVVLSMDHSFGYFDDAENAAMLRGIHRALRPKGRLVIDVVNRDVAIQHVPSRSWWEGAACVVLEEVDFNFATSQLHNKRSVVFDSGRHLEHEIVSRLYSWQELAKMLTEQGFSVLEVAGHPALRKRFFGAHSRSLIVVAEKR